MVYMPIVVSVYFYYNTKAKNNQRMEINTLMSNR